MLCELLELVRPFVSFFKSLFFIGREGLLSAAIFFFTGDLYVTLCDRIEALAPSVL